MSTETPVQIDPPVAIEVPKDDRDEISFQLGKLDATMAFTGGIRRKLIEKLAAGLDGFTDFSDMNGAALAGVASLASGLGSLLHQAEAAQVQRVRIETSIRQEKTNANLAEVALSVIRRISPVRTQVPEHTAVDDSDDQLEQVFQSGQLQINDEMLSEVDIVVEQIRDDDDFGPTEEE